MTSPDLEKSAHSDLPTQTSSSPAIVPSRWAVLTGCLALGFVVSLPLLILVGSNIWLAYAVPLTEQDLKLTSWAFSYSTSNHFAGLTGGVFAVMTLLMAAAAAIAKNSPLAFLAGLVAASGMLAAGSESIAARVGIAAEVVKIGCFVYETRECRAQLEVPVGDAPSMYEKGQLSDWYLARRREVLPNARGWWHIFPGASVLAAPFYAWHADELRAKVEAQRAEVAAFRAKHAAGTP